jgi:hypothetical protein
MERGLAELAECPSPGRHPNPQLPNRERISLQSE